MRACLRACVRACVHACVCVNIGVCICCGDQTTGQEYRNSHNFLIISKLSYYANIAWFWDSIEV